MKSTWILLGAAALAAACHAPAQAQLFSDDMSNGASWGMNISPDTDVAATFGYDYSADGIPEAPNSVGGPATTGVKLEANNGDGNDIGSYFTLYPTGQSFSGNIQLRFDAWMNHDADERVGAARGTTEFLGGGLGYDNVTADVASGAQLIVTGDGGSGSDYRAFKSPPQFFIDGSAMEGGSRNGAIAYHTDFFPEVAAPAVQGQTALSAAGSPGFQWVTFEVNTIGNLVNFWLEKPGGERHLIVRYDKTDTSDGSAGVSTDGNISLFYADFFSSISPRPDLTFGIIDNVVVSTVPEPATVALAGLAGLGLVALRRRGR